MRWIILISLSLGLAACVGNSQGLSRVEADLFPAGDQETAGLALYAYVVIPNSNSSRYRSEIRAVTEGFACLFDQPTGSGGRAEEKVGVIYYPISTDHIKAIRFKTTWYSTGSALVPVTEEVRKEYS